MYISILNLFFNFLYPVLFHQFVFFLSTKRFQIYTGQHRSFTAIHPRMRHTPTPIPNMFEAITCTRILRIKRIFTARESTLPPLLYFSSTSSQNSLVPYMGGSHITILGRLLHGFRQFEHHDCYSIVLDFTLQAQINFVKFR